MNKIHEDGHALLKLSRQAEHMAEKDLTKTPPGEDKTNAKPTPSPPVQRQDTDYDVKPSIKTPKSESGRSSTHKNKADANHSLQAAVSDKGVLVHATQMGESEWKIDHDASLHHARVLRALCS